MTEPKESPRTPSGIFIKNALPYPSDRGVMGQASWWFRWGPTVLVLMLVAGILLMINTIKSVIQ